MGRFLVMILGMGLDLAEVARFDLDTKAREWFGQRVFTDEELQYALRRRMWSQHLAGCFAVKEAFRKAVGRAVPWQSVGVTHLPSGAPELKLDDETKTLLYVKGVTKTHVSITHTKEHAAAVIVLEGPDRENT